MEEEEEETEPVDLIGDRLKEDVVSRGADAAPRPRCWQWALPLSHGAGFAEPPASSLARAERPAAAPGRQRRKCTLLGVLDLSAGFGGHSATASARVVVPVTGQGPSPSRGRDWGSPAHILLSLQVQPPDPTSIRVLRGHQLPVTCLVISPDDRFIFSASKDGALIKCKCSLGDATGCLPSLSPAGTLQQQDHECP